MFRTDLLSIIRSFDTVFTATGICHTIYVDCLLARLKWNSPSQPRYRKPNPGPAEQERVCEI